MMTQRKIGSIVEHETGNFEIIENNIVPKKKKQKFTLYLNLLAFPFLGVTMFLFLLPIQKTLSFTLPNNGSEMMKLVLIIVLTTVSFVAYIFVHEWLHGISFRVFNNNTKDQVKFGVVWKSAVAYCISTVPVKVSAARASLMMPIYIVCIPVWILAIILQNPWLGLLAAYYLSGSVGDIYYMWKLRKSDRNHYMHEEMPTPSGYEIGYLLYKKINERA